MTSGFSGAIKLAEMNDYLAPNQSCIKPLIKPKSGEAEAATAAAAVPASTGGARTRVVLEFGSNDAADLRFPGLQLPGSSAAAAPALAVASSAASGGHFGQMKLDPVKKTATVSLADCLACSGCVTSAETVLITQQSTEEFMQVLQANKDAIAAAAATAASDPDAMTDAPAASASAVPPALVPGYRSVVVSISPQSLTAIAHDLGLSALACAKRLNTFFVRDLQCRALFETTAALDIALLEAREEFVQRYKASHEKLTSGAAGSAVAPLARAAVAAAPSTSSATVASGGQTIIPSAASPLPILISECPGWVCYAEKTQGIDVLSHLSSVRSPQAIMGALLKLHWAGAQQPSIPPASLYHVTIMPCYDKKLEGSREDFYLTQFSTRETDVVLTTGELRELLEERGGRDWFHSLAETPLDRDFWNVDPDQTALYRSVDVGGSGGYCEYLYRYASRALFGRAIPADQALPYKPTRNPDFRELSLEVDGRTVLSFALAYGFRNIQNLVRKIKTKKPAALLPPSAAAAAAAAAASAGAAAGVMVAAQPAAASDSDPSDSDLMDLSTSLPAGAGGYHYVEVMASVDTCPSGCLNGGGQLKAPGGDIRAQKALVLDLDRAYHDEAQRQVCDPEDNQAVRRIYSTWLGGARPGEGLAKLLLHTQYHAIDKELANPLGIKW